MGTRTSTRTAKGPERKGRRSPPRFDQRVFYEPPKDASSLGDRPRLRSSHRGLSGEQLDKTVLTLQPDVERRTDEVQTKCFVDAPPSAIPELPRATIARSRGLHLLSRLAS